MINDNVTFMTILHKENRSSYQMSLIYEGLVAHINTSLQFAEMIGHRLEYNIERYQTYPDGITIITGDYSLIRKETDEVSQNVPFTCGVATYLLYLKGITIDICFKTCVSRHIQRIMNVAQE